MSLYGILNTSGSGMNAQSDKLGAVSDNISNVSTTGYKRSDVDFSSFLIDSGASDYQSGSVVPTTVRNVTDQGAFTYTSSATDLAIQGGGFFVVSGPNGQAVLTRAGAFQSSGNGNLVNSAGFSLLGYPITSSSSGTGAANAYAGLVPINISSLSLQAKPSTSGTMSLNLPSTDPIAATSNVTLNGTLDPSLGVGNSYTSNVTAYDSSGNPINLAVTFSETATTTSTNTWSYSIASPALSSPVTGSLSFDNTTGAYTTAPSPVSLTLSGVSSPVTLSLANLTQPSTGPDSVTGTSTAALPSANVASSGTTHKTSLVVYDDLGASTTLDVYTTKTAADTWDVAVYNSANAGTGSTAPFPYTSGPLATSTLSFNASNGSYASASQPLNFTIPGGSSFSLDMSKTSQLATNYTVNTAQANGNAPSEATGVQVSSTGVVYAVYANGSQVASYNIPLATVPSPDKLTALAGNVYQTNSTSGAVQIDTPGSGGSGTIVSSALENSDVDLSTELTTMIQTQSNYTANSKVFSTAAQLLDVLVNLRS